MTDRNEDIRVLHGLRRLMEAAENAGDADAIASVMADDVVLMVPTFDVQEGREASAAFIRDILQWLHEQFIRRVTYVSSEVAVHGDVAFDRGTFSFTTVPREGGPEGQATGKYFWLYFRAPDGGWKLARLIASLDEEEPEGEGGEDC